MSISKVSKSLLVCRPGFSELLRQELESRFRIESVVISPAAVQIESGLGNVSVHELIFARQLLPYVVAKSHVHSSSEQSELVELLLQGLKRAHLKDSSWTIHAYAIDNDEAMKTAKKVQGLLKVKVQSQERKLWECFVDSDQQASKQSIGLDAVIVQIFASTVDVVYFSIASVTNGVIPHVSGVKRLKPSHGAPSRSANKLVEALDFMNHLPVKGQSGVDLGAAPGGWTFVMASLGVTMTAVDHAELKLPKKKLPGQITQLKENGLTYLPEGSVDWLCCDMVIGAKQTLEVLYNWISGDKLQSFVVNVKLPLANPWSSVREAIAFVDFERSTGRWEFLQAKQLFADRSEITIMGSRKPVRK